MLGIVTRYPGASQDTWGISGPHFATLYFLAMLACALLMALARRVLGGRGAGAESLLDGLEPEQIALLTRDDAAVATALASLTASNGAVSTRGQLVPDDDVVALRRAVQSAQASGRARTFEQLTHDAEVTAALRALRASLTERGLLIAPARRVLLRLRFLLPLALTLVGFARLVAGWLNHKPITLILIETVIMAVSTFVSALYCRSEPAASRPARQALIELRRASPKLLPEAMTSRRRGPAMARVAPMSVALFGTAALVHADPALAEALDIPTVQYATMPLSTDGVSSSSSSSNASSYSSCGGSSSCGSSCGG